MLDTWPVLCACNAKSKERSAVEPPAPHVMSVYRHLVLASIRSIRAWRFCTPCSVRGGKYSSETWAMLVGSFVNKSMILGSGGSSEWPFMVDSVWFLGDMSGLIVVFVITCVVY